ncbi:SPARC-related modular calcium-binding protein 1 isoform X4 [Hemicordylus capensis]|uniref:SPARC-related modular calcium-binding protein 1 isoform X4 n=1 Tax=Hemicordylus capensis TaxID=884348 RepID=UPI0023043D39|nr:SPARC-related modular calcium-binding protein 1 isoform X4 [Hemicordylus capensis]
MEGKACREEIRLKKKLQKGCEISVGSQNQSKKALATNSSEFLISDRDRDPQCNLHCSRSPAKPLCASDGRTYESMCDYQRAKCRDSSLSVVHRGRCKDAGQSKCRLERAQAMDQAKKPQEAVFIPECSEDGSFTQVQCHTYTGYCWCVTPDGKPISGSSVQNKTPVCSGSVTDKPLGQGNSGRKEITAPTLWIKHLVIKDSKLNSSSMKNSEKVNSCDQERQSALEEARQNPREGIVIPECAPGGLYKPVQCHQSTGYCWCVLVDTGRPLPGTSTRYETPVCESDARSRSTEIDDPFKERELPGCPEGKKVEFITSLLDALTTDMVQAINSAAPAAGGRLAVASPRLQTGSLSALSWRCQGGNLESSACKHTDVLSRADSSPKENILQCSHVVSHSNANQGRPCLAKRTIHACYHKTSSPPADVLKGNICCYKSDTIRTDVRSYF